jgi:hypothetical protein
MQRRPQQMRPPGGPRDVLSQSIAKVESASGAAQLDPALRRRARPRATPYPGTQPRHRFVTAAPNSASWTPVNRQGATMFPIRKAGRRWKIRHRDLYEGLIDRNAGPTEMTIESGDPAHMNGV